MNKKGFTLVELLAVIVIIAIVSAIAVVSMNGVRNKIDLKMVESNIDLIISSAKSYGEDHMSEIKSGKFMTVEELKANTELDIDDAYNDIELTILLVNRRASACILNSDPLEDIVGSDNMSYFSRYYCEVTG